MQKFTSQAARLAAFILVLALFASMQASAQQGARERARAARATGDLTAAAPLYAQAIKDSPEDKDLLVEAGDMFMELEQFETARDLYDHARTLDKNNAVIIRKYGQALSALGDHPRAIGVLSGLLDKDKSLENYLAVGHAYIDAGKDSLQRAELTFQLAGQKYKNSADVAVALGDLYFASQVYELALAKYEEAIKLDSTLVEPSIKLGRAYREQARRLVGSGDTAGSVENYNSAIAAFTRVTQIAPKQSRPWLELGEIYLLARDYERAAVALNTYVQLRPDDSRGDIMLARAAYEGNYYKVSIEAFDRLATRKDSASQAFMATAYPMIGKSYFLAKDYVKAREAYLKASDSSLDLEAKRFRISSILLSGGDSLRALDYSRQLIAENPTDCDLSGNFSSLLYSMKRYDEVIKVLNDRMVACPDAPKATPYLFIGLSHLAKQRYSDAISALEQSITADTNSFQGYYWLMTAYSQSKDFAKAGGMANVMLEHRFDTSHPKEVAIAYFFRGADRMNVKDFKAAIAEFDHAIKLNQEYASAYLYTAFAYQSMNDKDNACKYYKLTLKYEPGNADAKKYMKAIGCS